MKDSIDVSAREFWVFSKINITGKVCNLKHKARKIFMLDMKKWEFLSARSYMNKFLSSLRFPQISCLRNLSDGILFLIFFANFLMPIALIPRSTSDKRCKIGYSFFYLVPSRL